MFFSLLVQQYQYFCSASESRKDTLLAKIMGHMERDLFLIQMLDFLGNPE